MSAHDDTPDAARLLSRQGRRLIQIGSVLFLCALVLGLFVQKFAIPRLALSAHLLGLMQGLFVMVAGLMWPKLLLTRISAAIAFYLLLYGCFAALLANLLGALWGAGSSLLPIAAGAARGSSGQELTIVLGLRSAGAALIISVALLVWGLRYPDGE
jgi:hydroxylaminobenzene mutase